MDYNEHAKLVKRIVDHYNNPILIMMVGLQGSGKTTLANEIQSCIEIGSGREVHICSSDRIRGQLFGDESVQTNNDEVFNVLHKNIKTLLKGTNVVIYDATNVNKKRRKAFLKEVSYIENLYKLCLCMAVSIYDCQEHLILRKNGVHVPTEVLMRTYRSWQPPYWDEGWDDIKVVYPDNVSFDNILSILRKFEDYDQGSKHHSLTLGDHLKKTAELLYKNDQLESIKNCFEVWLSGYLHDIGKPDCRSEDERGSHYYNHNNTSAYLSLFVEHADPQTDKIEIANLIYWHMLPYDPHGKKKLNKIKEEYGDDFYKGLMLLHEADVGAH